MIEQPAPLPPGFRIDTGTDFGLILPEELSRVREVITKAQWKRVSIVVKEVCQPLNIRFVWCCNKCYEATKDRDASMLKKVRHGDGGFILRCDHRDIVYSPKI